MPISDANAVQTRVARDHQHLIVAIAHEAENDALLSIEPHAFCDLLSPLNHNAVDFDLALTIAVDDRVTAPVSAELVGVVS
ncbi:hypothetical protein D3C86_1946900 [compost metagenome]